jgi:hypothetical protein
VFSTVPEPEKESFEQKETKAGMGSVFRAEEEDLCVSGRGNIREGENHFDYRSRPGAIAADNVNILRRDGGK